VLVPEARAGRTFREYHRAHRQAAATQGADAPTFGIPNVGDPYPRCSFPALEAAVWVRQTSSERFPTFDAVLFEGFFGRNEDISDSTILVRLAEQCGLDGRALIGALRDGNCREQVVVESREAGRLAITAIPAVVLPGRPPIVGAVPYADLRRAVEAALRGNGAT
jgi:predicted DsbA family dithiol-disulfide isomerase